MNHRHGGSQVHDLKNRSAGCDSVPYLHLSLGNDSTDRRTYLSVIKLSLGLFTEQLCLLEGKLIVRILRFTHQILLIQLFGALKFQSRLIKLRLGLFVFRALTITFQSQ